MKSLVLEIAGTNVATTFISCPQDPKKVLGIKLPFLIMIIKNMKKYFTFEITVILRSFQIIQRLLEENNYFIFIILKLDPR